jgi:hypothetical protein
LYTLLYQAVPFFTMLRAPARFGLLVTLSLVVIGSLGLAALTRQIRPSTRRVLIPGLIAFALARSTVGPLRLTDVPPTPAAYRRLASLPASPVAEFPFFIGGGERYRHTEYMLWSTLHWKPMLNGYSDHVPRDAYEDEVKLARFPEPVAWDVLREHDVRYVVVHWRFMSGDDVALTRSRLGDLRDRELAAGPGRDDPGDYACVLTRSSTRRASAASSVSAFLQNVNRTCVRPDAGSR